MIQTQTSCTALKRRLKTSSRILKKQFGTYAGLRSEDLRDEAQRRGIAIGKVRKAREDPKIIRNLTKKFFFEGITSTPICCFTEVPHNILMWSYYSSGHAGFSYVFSCKPENYFRALTAIADVRYLSERPTVTTVDILRRMATRKDENHYEEDDRTRDRVDNASLLSKADIWRHEKEWRSLLLPASSVGYHSIDPYQLTGVIFGVNSDAKLVEFISARVGKTVKMFKCALHNEKYGLEIAPLG